MKSIVLACSLALCAWTAPAAAVVFDDTQYFTTTFAAVGAVSDSDADSSPLSTLPLLTSSDAIGDDGGAASAFGIADAGFLSAGTDAVGGPDGSSALTSAEFLGSFVADGRPILIALDIGTSGIGNAIRLIVTGDGGTLFDQTWAAAGMFQSYLDIAAGTLGSINIIATSSTDVPFGDIASASASAGFAVTSVPEPSTLVFMVLAGLCAFAALQAQHLRRRRCERATQDC